jgi:hypothetical protein
MTSRSIFTLALLAASVGSPSTANADAPKANPRAINEIWNAMSACMSVRSRKSVDEGTYLKFVSSLEAAKKIDPNVTSSEEKAAGLVIKVELPKCEPVFAEYASGKGHENDPVSSACINNTNARLDTILSTAEKDFAEKGQSYIVWFRRKDLEAARFVMTLGKEGYAAAGARCETPDPKKKAFQAVVEKFNRAEQVVRKIEAAKGVVFKGVRDQTNVVYVDAKTQAEVARADRV